MFFTKNVYFFYFFCPNGQISKTKELLIQKIWFAKLFNDVGLTTIAMWECAFIYIYNKLWILDNWNKFKSFIYISLLFYNLISKAICSDCTDLCFLEKGKNRSQNLSHFENENTFRRRTTFWKQKLISKPILKMKMFSFSKCTLNEYHFL